MVFQLPKGPHFDEFPGKNWSSEWKLPGEFEPHALNSHPYETPLTAFPAAYLGVESTFCHVIALWHVANPFIC